MIPQAAQNLRINAQSRFRFLPSRTALFLLGPCPDPGPRNQVATFRRSQWITREIYTYDIISIIFTDKTRESVKIISIEAGYARTALCATTIIRSRPQISEDHDVRILPVFCTANMSLTPAAPKFYHNARRHEASSAHV